MTLFTSLELNPRYRCPRGPVMAASSAFAVGGSAAIGVGRGEQGNGRAVSMRILVSLQTSRVNVVLDPDGQLQRHRRAIKIVSPKYSVSAKTLVRALFWAHSLLALEPVATPRANDGSHGQQPRGGFLARMRVTSCCPMHGLARREC